MISIIIPTKDRESIIHDSLVALENLVKKYTLEIIVINDSKQNDLNELYQKFQFIKIYNNLKSGVASARNLGVINASNEKIIFMDDDIIITEEALKSAINFFIEHPHSCLNVDWRYPDKLYEKCKKHKFGRYLLYYQFDSLKGWRKNDLWEENTQFKVNGGASYFLIINKTIFNKIGGYNEKFPYSGYEDADFNKRLVNNSINIYIDSSVFVYHNEIDKTHLKTWLLRKQNTYRTIRIAYNMGDKSAILHLSRVKINIYKILNPFRNFILNVYYLIPNLTFFDKISFKFIDLLHGIHSYKGFFQVKN